MGLLLYFVYTVHCTDDKWTEQTKRKILKLKCYNATYIYIYSTIYVPARDMTNACFRFHAAVALASKYNIQYTYSVCNVCVWFYDHVSHDRDRMPIITILECDMKVIVWLQANAQENHSVGRLGINSPWCWRTHEASIISDVCAKNKISDFYLTHRPIFLQQFISFFFTQKFDCDCCENTTFFFLFSSAIFGRHSINV